MSTTNSPASEPAKQDQQEPKKSPSVETTTEPAKGSEVKTEYSNPNPEIEKLRKDFESLRGIHASKDKEIADLKKTVNEANDTLKKIQSQAELNKLISSSDLPKTVQEWLGDEQDLSPENFKDKSEKFKSRYEAIEAETRVKYGVTISKDPDPKKESEFNGSIQNAKSLDDLTTILKSKK